MLTKSQLAKFKKVDVSTCKADPLVDLQKIYIDTTKPVTQRIESFLKQIHNPYVFKVGDIIMKVDYGNGKQFAQAFTDILCKEANYYH